MLTYGNNVALKCSTSALRVALVLTCVSNSLVDEKAKIKRDSENQSKRPLGHVNYRHRKIGGFHVTSSPQCFFFFFFFFFLYFIFFYS